MRLREFGICLGIFIGITPNLYSQENVDGCREAVDKAHQEKPSDPEAIKKAVADFYAGRFQGDASGESIKTYCDNEINDLKKRWKGSWGATRFSKTQQCLNALEGLCESGELHYVASSEDKTYEYIDPMFQRKGEASCTRPDNLIENTCVDLTKYATHKDLFGACTTKPQLNPNACPKEDLVGSCSRVDTDGHQTVILRGYAPWTAEKFKALCEKDGGTFMAAR